MTQRERERERERETERGLIHACTHRLPDVVHTDSQIQARRGFRHVTTDIIRKGLLTVGKCLGLLMFSAAQF